MKARNFIASAVAACSVFAFSSFAFAANHVTLKTTVPNIPKSACDQAGTITMELDTNTVMKGGDTIQFTLNSAVTLCKAVDMFVAMADDGSETLLPDTSLPVSAPTGSLIVSGTGVLTGAGANGIADTGALTIDGSSAVVGFRVKGSVGSSIVTATLGYLDANANHAFKPQNNAGDFLLTLTGVGADERLSIKLFDGKVNQFYLREYDSASSNPADAADTYADNQIEAEDNALCIDTEDFTSELVIATPDSIVSDVAYKLGFSGDYTVAHIAASDAYYVQTVCKDACPTVLMGTSTDQFGVETTPGASFDASSYEAGAVATGEDRWESVGTCDTDLGNGVIIKRGGQNFTPNQKFSVTIELLIDGVAANEDVVSWNTAGATAAYYVSSSDAGRCSGGATAMTAGSAPAWAKTSANNGAIVEATLTAGTSHDAFIIDLPPVTFDYKKVVAGTKVEAKVTFGKYPCGGTDNATVCLATFVDKCASSDAYSLLYPFATGAANATFWSGVVVTNTDSETCNATITLYDTAGGSGSLAVAIDGKSQYVKTIGQIVADAAFQNGTTALDTAKDVQIEVTADTVVDGLIFVGADGVMHGYLPRVYKNGSAVH